MNSIVVKGTIRNGRVEVDEPIGLPDGTAVVVTATPTVADDVPMSSEEIADVLAAMEKVEPFDMTPEEEAAIEAGRRDIRAYTIANMDKKIEGLFP